MQYATKERFRKLWQRFGGESLLAYHYLTTNYNGADRAYHTLYHISAGLGLLDQVKSYCQDPNAIEIAWWFHDFIYNPRANDNEQQSADSATRFLSSAGLDQALVEKVHRLILATTHQTPLSDYDEQIIADIDLANLGADYEQYLLASRQIRKEYCHVSDYDFRKGRIKFLQSLLDRDHIFYTEYFRQKYEAQARSNLARGIQELSAVK